MDAQLQAIPAATAAAAVAAFHVSSAPSPFRPPKPRVGAPAVLQASAVIRLKRIQSERCSMRLRVGYGCGRKRRGLRRKTARCLDVPFIAGVGGVTRGGFEERKRSKIQGDVRREDSTWRWKTQVCAVLPINITHRIIFCTLGHKFFSFSFQV